jgi:2',5'-phosphodiesterase
LNKTFEELLPTFEKNSDEFCLKINESCYQLRYNWPTINQLTLPTSILAGFFIYPSKCDLDYANKHCSEFLWFKGKLPNSKKENEIVWEEVGRGFCFLVRSEDIGYRIKLVFKWKPLQRMKCKPGPDIVHSKRDNFTQRRD